MKNIIYRLIIFFFISLIILIIILSTIGIETKKFNDLISQRINQNNKGVNLKLNTIKFKLDIKEASLFLDTQNPKINYRNVIVPTKNIKAYIDFLSILKTEPKIEKINLALKEMDTNQLKKLLIFLKPSNLKSFVNNKINQGKIEAEVEFYLNKKNLLEDFIARGAVSDLEIKINDDLNLEKTKFSFFTDKTDLLVKNIFSKSKSFNVENGDLKLIFSPEVSLSSNFKTSFKYDYKKDGEFNFLSNNIYFKNIINFDAELINNIKVEFDNTYKIKNYEYKNNGKILKASLEFQKPIKNYFLYEDIKDLTLENSEIFTDFNLNKKDLKIQGNYSLNQRNPLKFFLENSLNNKNNNQKLKVSANYDNFISLDLINYKKPKDIISEISFNLDKQEKNYKISELNFKNEKDLIFIKDLIFRDNKFLSFDTVSVKTYKNNVKNNDFSIKFGKDITIKGDLIDASNLPKFLNQKTKNKSFQSVNGNLEINIDNIIAPLSERLENFKLIGRINRGKFSKISSKGDFGNDRYLDITLRNDEKNKKNYLEIYSDVTKPFLTEYDFFKGLTGGTIFYSSIQEENSSISKLKIENFKVINAPGMVKLLSLADLRGLADLAEGEGLSFDILEISMEKNGNILKLNEIVALGPSISVLMEGYQDKNVTSLRGTLVPAKTLNTIISKIPVIGNIVIPKEVGEGLFGISFKMKGPTGKIKTTINPIRTITPRFIQKIIDKKNKTK